MKNQYFVKCFIALLIVTFNYTNTKAQVVINEIMQSNLNVIMDDLNDYPDSWVELYNAGDNVVNLQNYALGTKKKYTSNYLLPSYSLQPKSFVVIYCDKEGSGLHADFRVESGSKGNLYLFDSSETQIDAITNLAAMPSPDVAYGRTTDGGPNWNYFVTPTPGKSNITSVATDVILPAPLFSVKGGVFTSSFMLSIAKPEDAPSDAVIRYTLDGSEPIKTSAVFSNGASMSISSTKVVRAKLFSDNAISPMSTTHTYIFHGRKVTLPIISVTTDKKNFYDDYIGIYHDGKYSPGTENFRYNWRRPINFEYFDLDDNKEAVLNQLCETRVSGGASREAPMKSLIVYSNKRFGTKDFAYPLFNDKPEIPIKSFLMRNGGNDFLWGHMRDAAIQLICHRGGMDIDWQAYQPTIWYLNGSYMGIINLRERSNEDHIYSNYNKLEDIDMFENWGELKSGTWDNLNAFQEFYSKSNNTYEEWEQWMDVSEFMNMFIINTYHVNLDFPGNNIVMWRPIAEGGRWRWIIKDTDFGLGLYDRPYTYNYLNFILRTGTHEENWANTWDATRLFRRLIGNEQFKNEFIDRFAVALGDYLCNEFGATIIDSLKNNIAYEYPYFRSRYSDYNSWLNWNDETTKMKTWMSNRTNYMYIHLKDYFSLGNLVSIRVNTATNSPNDVMIDFNENKLSRSFFKGYFYTNREIRLNGQATANDKEVSGWKLIKTINGTQTTETIVGNSLTYTIPTNCTYLNIDPILDIKTNIEDSHLSKWKIVNEDDGVRLTQLEIGSLVTLYNSNGQLIFSNTAETDEIKISLVTKGVYMIKIANDNNFETQKVVF